MRLLQKAISVILLLVCMGMYAQEKELTVAERNAAQGFNDTIDRLAPDFVQVSLMVADPTDWREDALGTSGHAFLRLQCPTFGLDYCFSYEGENVNDNIFRYISGKTKMGMFAVPTNEYLEDYHRWNRSVHEYHLAMPPETEQKLWEIMDNHITPGITLRQDLNKYGCAITAVKYVKIALGKTPIVYAEDEELARLSRREIGYRSLHNHPWLRLSSMLMTCNNEDDDMPIDEKLIIPADLAEVWQHATVNDQTFATYLGDIVEGAPIDETRPWFTPMVLAIVILIITILCTFISKPYWDYVLLSVQALSGIALIVTAIVMKEFGGSGYILMALFNPLPLLLWKWRKYWVLLYAIALTAGVIALVCMPHMLVDPAFLIIACAYALLYLKDNLRNVYYTKVFQRAKA